MRTRVGRRREGGKEGVVHGGKEGRKTSDEHGKRRERAGAGAQSTEEGRKK